jgi:hypothetical protein
MDSWGDAIYLNCKPSGEYFDPPKTHRALFYKENARYALWRVENERGVTWFKLINYYQLRAYMPEIMDMLLRNGECLYNRIDTKDKKIFDIRYL